MGSWKETQGKTQNLLEVLHISPGLGTCNFIRVVNEELGGVTKVRDVSITVFDLLPLGHNFRSLDENELMQIDGNCISCSKLTSISSNQMSHLILINGNVTKRWTFHWSAPKPNGTKQI